jgi:hypothetical protein
VAVAREFSLRGIALGTLSTHFSSYPSELRRRAVRLVVQGLDVFVRDGTIQTLIVADVVRLANRQKLSQRGDDASFFRQEPHQSPSVGS